MLPKSGVRAAGGIGKPTLRERGELNKGKRPMTSADDSGVEITTLQVETIPIMFDGGTRKHEKSDDAHLDSLDNAAAQLNGLDRRKVEVVESDSVFVTESKKNDLEQKKVERVGHDIVRVPHGEPVRLRSTFQRVAEMQIS